MLSIPSFLVQLPIETKVSKSGEEDDEMDIRTQTRLLLDDFDRTICRNRIALLSDVHLAAFNTNGTCTPGFPFYIYKRE